MTFADDCETEIRDFHVFIEGWLAGRLPDNDETYQRAHEALADDFEIVSPSGDRRPRRALLDEMRDAHGLHADSDPEFGIEIRAVRHRLTEDELCLLTYEEHQRVDGEWTARLSSVLFRQSESTPNGVEWVHLHETWLDGE